MVLVRGKPRVFAKLFADCDERNMIPLSTYMHLLQIVNVHQNQLLSLGLLCLDAMAPTVPQASYLSRFENIATYHFLSIC